MAKTPKPKNEFIGRWRVTWMEQWDQDFVNEDVEGYFEFQKYGQGEFQFGYVHGFIDDRPGTKDGKPCIEFSWDGNDEMEAATGRGWALVDGNEIEGMIVLHQGDESGFKAVRKK